MVNSGFLLLRIFHRGASRERKIWPSAIACGSCCSTVGRCIAPSGETVGGATLQNPPTLALPGVPGEGIEARCRLRATAVRFGPSAALSRGDNGPEFLSYE